MEKSERLDNLRLALGFKTKRSFAEALGISDQTLSNWYSRNTFDENLILRKFTNVNDVWLLTGKGEMLKSQTAIGDHNTQVAGNSNSVNSSGTLDKALDEIAAQRMLVAKSQEQIDRLLTIIETMRGKNEGSDE